MLGFRMPLLFLPFGIRRIALDCTLKVYLHGLMANHPIDWLLSVPAPRALLLSSYSSDGGERPYEYGSHERRTIKTLPPHIGFAESVRACLKSRMRGHAIVGVMTISTDVDNRLAQA
jgi:hypothetical protein